MHELRPPTARDVPMLARLHVQGWEETYRGLLPPSEFDSHGLEVRLSQWSRQVAAGTSRIALAPGLGFAQMGPQRDRTEATAAYPDELYCLYVLREAHGTGLGAALLAAVRGGRPFTSMVLDENARACAFYEKQGGQLLATRPERLGETEISERIYGFGRPADGYL